MDTTVYKEVDFTKRVSYSWIRSSVIRCSLCYQDHLHLETQESPTIIIANRSDGSQLFFCEQCIKNLSWLYRGDKC